MKALVLCLLFLLIVLECNCEVWITKFNSNQMFKILFSMRRANRLVKKHISEKKLKYKHK